MKKAPKIPRIMLIMDEGRGPGRDVMSGVASYARIFGPWQFKTASPFYTAANATTERSLSALKNWRPDGIITLDVEDLTILDKLKKPMVIARTVFRGSLPYPQIISDDKAIGKMAADYFLDRGFRQFAFCGFEGLTWSEDRGGEFEKAIEEYNAKTLVYQKHGKRTRSTYEGEVVQLQKWVKTLPRPLALFAANDDRARQVCDACTNEGLKIPEDIAILGVDNDTLVCNLGSVPLSSIAVSFVKSGFEAAQVLDAMMHNQKPPTDQIILRPTAVITRRSTDISAISDPDVAAAINFIRQNVKKNIQLKDLMQAIVIPRRTLYLKFMDTLGYSAAEAIDRIRTQEISKVLAETNLSVAEISHMFNFSSPKHISRYFTSRMKLSPMEYRRQHQPAVKPGEKAE